LEEIAMTDAAAEEFSLKLEGNGVSIERMVNRSIAMAILAAVLGGSEATAASHTAPEAAPTVPNISPREFLAQTGATSNAEKLTALGQYLCEHEKAESFSRDDVRGAFRRAHEVIPKNLPRDFGTAVQSGWIHESPGKAGRFYVTRTGMQLVENGFSKGK
jgi:hypothetical protein